MVESTSNGAVEAPAVVVEKKAPKPAKTPKSTASVVKTATHPTTEVMVKEALAALNDKKGTTLQALKKYMVETHKVDMTRLAPFLKKYLKKAVESGNLVQTKGTGAAGSFKLPVKEVVPKKKVVTKKAKPAAVKKAVAKPKTNSAKATASPSKAKGAAATKKPVAKKVGSPAKAKVTNKPAAKKEVKEVVAEVSPVAATPVQKVKKAPAKPKSPKAKKLVKAANPKPTAAKAKGAAKEKSTKKTAPKAKK